MPVFKSVTSLLSDAVMGRIEVILLYGVVMYCLEIEVNSGVFVVVVVDEVKGIEVVDFVWEIVVMGTSVDVNEWEVVVNVVVVDGIVVVVVVVLVEVVDSVWWIVVTGIWVVVSVDVVVVEWVVVEVVGISVVIKVVGLYVVERIVVIGISVVNLDVNEWVVVKKVVGAFVVVIGICIVVSVEMIEWVVVIKVVFVEVIDWMNDVGISVVIWVVNERVVDGWDEVKGINVEWIEVSELNWDSVVILWVDVNAMDVKGTVESLFVVGCEIKWVEVGFVFIRWVVKVDCSVFVVIVEVGFTIVDWFILWVVVWGIKLVEFEGAFVIWVVIGVDCKLFVVIDEIKSVEVGFVFIKWVVNVDCTSFVVILDCGWNVDEFIWLVVVAFVKWVVIGEDCTLFVDEMKSVEVGFEFIAWAVKVDDCKLFVFVGGIEVISLVEWFGTMVVSMVDEANGVEVELEEKEKWFDVSKFLNSVES